MSLSRLAVRDLYTRGIDRYSSFIAAFQSPQGIRELLQRSSLLRSGLRVLDAGCGFGVMTFAFLEALRQKNLDYKSIDAFDLTPAMVCRFQKTLEVRGVTRVQLLQADVLAIETLPPSWTNYDLILSASMLEYLPKQDLPRALQGLHARMAPGGRILVLITRKTPETKVLIEWWWHAERYTKNELLRAFEEAGFQDPAFLRFPMRYIWLNRATYAVEARSVISRGDGGRESDPSLPETGSPWCRGSGDS
jgi:cyclopropane fatty-acyl-phospholipid synthase-like methyltransferase